MNWKKNICFAVSGLFMISSTQAALVLSNLANASTGNSGIFFPGEAVLSAQSFQVGDVDYFFDSVEIPVDNVFDSTEPLIFSVYSNDAGKPGALVSALTTPGNPTIPGTYIYSPSSALTLTAGTIYWVVGSTTGSANYTWSTTTDAAFSATGSWSIPTTRVFSTNAGATWNLTPTNYTRMAINATAIPEPTATALLLAGALAYGIVRVRQRQTIG